MSVLQISLSAAAATAAAERNKDYTDVYVHHVHCTVKELAATKFCVHRIVDRVCGFLLC